jgi:hypothetical protein
MTQSKALRLAEDMLNCSFGRTVTVQKAAAELRRLSAVEAQRDALLEACKAYDQWADKTLCYDRELRPIRAQIRAAIKAVEEGK